MRHAIIFFLLVVAHAAYAQDFQHGSLAAEQQAEWPQCVLPGDYPDPSIVRDGRDFYMTHSPFHYQPGFLIWHSRDLVHWEPVCRAVPRYRGSAMAPDLVKYKGRFYLYWPADGTNFVAWADDIRGPWSEPIDLHIGYIDPGHAADAAGHRYLYTSDGHVTPLTDDGLARAGATRRVYDGWESPVPWRQEPRWCEGKYLESPKITRRGDYYYLTSAEGGTAGPATSHMAIVARSKSVLGPWENMPANPLIHTQSAAEPWWSAGHGTLIDDADGQWWIVYHAYPRNGHALGRATLLDPVSWTADGWPQLDRARRPSGRQEIAPATIDDDFRGPALGWQWTFWGEYVPEALAFGRDGMTVQGRGDMPARARRLLTTATHRAYQVEAELAVDKGVTAGLLLYYNGKAYAGLTTDGTSCVVYKSATDSVVATPRLGRRAHIRLTNHGSRLDISVSRDGRKWQTVAAGIDIADMHHNRLGGFYALRPALVVMGKGKATFRRFRYQGIRE